MSGPGVDAWRVARGRFIPVRWWDWVKFLVADVDQAQRGAGSEPAHMSTVCNFSTSSEEIEKASRHLQKEPRDGHDKGG